MLLLLLLLMMMMMAVETKAGTVGMQRCIVWWAVFGRRSHTHRTWATVPRTRCARRGAADKHRDT
jgi:hypothetical protein